MFNNQIANEARELMKDDSWHETSQSKQTTSNN